MFRSPVVVADPLTHVDVDPPEELVPLSVLALDLAQPAEGWNIYLAGRGITVTVDDLGRTAIARGDARRLFVERRENEARVVRRRLSWFHPIHTVPDGDES